MTEDDFATISKQYPHYISLGTIERGGAVPDIDPITMSDEEFAKLIDAEKDAELLRQCYVALGSSDETQHKRYLVGLRGAYVPINWEGVETPALDIYYNPRMKKRNLGAEKATADAIYAHAKAREDRSQRIKQITKELEAQEAN